MKIIRIRAFTQTIPVSEDAIEVRMEIKYEKNTEGKIIVSGKTNLFDGAQLLISITPDGKFYGPSCKVNCLNGTFTSVPLGNGTNLSGKCKIEYYDACKFCTTNRICKKVRYAV